MALSFSGHGGNISICSLQTFTIPLLALSTNELNGTKINLFFGNIRDKISNNHQ